jgi:hypothetical protein
MRAPDRSSDWGSINAGAPGHRKHGGHDVHQEEEEQRVLLINDELTDADSSSTANSSQASLSQWKLIALGSYWFSLLFFFSSIYVIIAPAKAASISDSQKGR